MFSKRYSEAEMEQWHTAACTCATQAQNDAPRQTAARSAMAKGQAEAFPQASMRDAAAADSAAAPADWASECLFECYNA